MDKNNLEPISINIKFDKNLEKITGISNYPIIMSEGSNFMFLLDTIFTEYPQIIKTYKPGELGFTINDYPPKEYSPLFDGDIVDFRILKK